VKTSHQTTSYRLLLSALLSIAGCPEAADTNDAQPFDAPPSDALPRDAANLDVILDSSHPYDGGESDDVDLDASATIALDTAAIDADELDAVAHDAPPTLDLDAYVGVLDASTADAVGWAISPDAAQLPDAFATADAPERLDATEVPDAVVSVADVGPTDAGPPPHVVEIAAGGYHTCALMSDGTVRCWGHNGYNQLGLGPGGGAERDEPSIVPGIGGVTALDGSERATCALRRDGELHCWGTECYGELGFGTVFATLCVPHYVPEHVTGLSAVRSVDLGWNHSCVVSVGGTVLCAGYNRDGQLGDGTTLQSTSYVGVTGIASAAQVSVAYSSSCARLDDGTATCWGQGGFGALGDGLTVDRLVPTTDVSVPEPLLGMNGGEASYGFSAVGVSGEVWGWGDNGYGTVGDGTVLQRPTPAAASGIATATAVVASGYHSCALLSDRTVRCWGRNDSGELGDGTTTNRLVPVPVTGLTDVVQVSVGTLHSCALRADWSVYCWGDNDSGQLGDGTRVIDRLTPVRVAGL
jgi:alpha-tubulin suppressor-like RCC1 family protein